jgi:hypothetical protein
MLRMHPSLFKFIRIKLRGLKVLKLLFQSMKLAADEKIKIPRLLSTTIHI